MRNRFFKWLASKIQPYIVEEIIISIRKRDGKYIYAATPEDWASLYQVELKREINE